MRLESNGWLRDMRGASGEVVFKRIYGRQVVAQKPRRSLRTPSAAQLAVQGKFKKSGQWAQLALRDPVFGLPYRTAARARNTNAFGLAVRDYHRAPVVEDIVLAGYKGQVGNLILVKAHDDFEIVTLHVTVKDPTGTVLEDGEATRGLGDEYEYVAQTVAPPGTVLTIAATATDRAGNKATLERPYNG